MSLQVHVDGAGDTAYLRLEGVIDERFAPETLMSKLVPVSIVDLSGIQRITSFGVRRWTEAMAALPQSIKHLYLVRCPPCFVDQLNMVLNFGGRSEVLSIGAGGYCEKCDEERTLEVDVASDQGRKLLQRPVCPTCQSPLQLDQEPAQLLRFTSRYPVNQLHPSAAATLTRLGMQVERPPSAPPEETKLVFGEITLFVIKGTLDSRFKPRRLASGVEGEVVFDLGGVIRADEAGCARWKQLLESLDAAVAIVIVDLPIALVPLVLSEDLSLGRAALFSVRAKGYCDKCSKAVWVGVRPGPIAKIGRPPCPVCSESLDLDCDLTDLQKLFERPEIRAEIPPAVEEFVPRRGELLAAEEGAQRPGDGLDKYEILRPLSQGGMAELFLAVRKGAGGFEKQIALKKIRRTMLERKHVAVELFLNEAKIAAHLNHPNIVHVFEVGEQAGDLFIAMEYIHGVDCRELLRKAIGLGHNLSVEVVLSILSQVAGALDHAHNATDLNGQRLNIVHRDVSPNNIVLGFDGQVKLVDFGVATASVVDNSTDGLMGKFSYMSPEQIRNEKLDGRSDVFALGVVMHEMLAKKALFRRSADAATLDAVLNAPIPPLSDHGVPAYVDEVVKRALERDRDKRFASARQLQLAIDGCLQTLGRTSGAHALAELLKQFFPERSALPLVSDEATTHAKPEGQATPSDRSRTYQAPRAPWKDTSPSVDEKRPSGEHSPIGAPPAVRPPTPLYTSDPRVSSVPIPANKSSSEPEGRRMIWLVVALLFFLGAGALVFSLLT